MFDLEDQRNSAGRPLLATIGVADVKIAEEAYCALLGYECVDAAPLSEAYSDLWESDEAAHRPARLLRPQSGAPVFIRLVEMDRGAASQSSARAGWFALEICVQDAAALHETLCAHGYFTPFAPPKALPFSDMVFPFQCRGGNGELLYLNETRGNLPELDLPLAASFVDHIFIVVLGASEISRTTDFYTRLLEASVQERHEIPYKTINRVFDLPLDTLHKLHTLGAGRNVSLEIDQLPLQADGQGQRPAISSGICCVSFGVGGEEGQGEPWTEITDAPYCGRAVRHVRGPDGERVELVMMPAQAVTDQA